MTPETSMGTDPTSGESTGSQPEGGLVGHWPLDDGSGMMAIDVSGNENHGTLVGSPQWVSTLGDGVGLSLDPTDGEADYVQLPNVPPLDDFELSSYSVSVWFQPLSTPTGQGASFEYALVQRSGFHRGLAYTTDQDVAYDNWYEPGEQVSAFGGFATSGSWYHVVGILDVESGRSQVYLDGEVAGQAGFPAGANLELGDGPWRIGIADPGSGRFENAAHIIVDDVRLFSGALTVEEISDLFQAGP